MRAPVVIAATAAGLAAVLAYHPHGGASSAATVVAASAGAKSSGQTAGGSSGAGSGSGTQTIAGAAESNQYGTVQVQIKVANGRLTDVSVLQVPESDPRSAQINATAVPMLRSEALSAQSASLDGVSGATYTSASYEASLASALTLAGIT
jgi:uncharacterized protein with FMN-binding domain